MPEAPDLPAAATRTGDWHLYVLRTAHGTLYTGIATDVARRLGEHVAGGTRAARSLRGRTPLALVYTACIGDRSLALRAEHALKHLARAAKEEIVNDAPDRAALLGKLGIRPPD